MRVGERRWRQAVSDQCATFTTSYLGHRIYFNGSSPPLAILLLRGLERGAVLLLLPRLYTYVVSLFLCFFLSRRLPRLPFVSLQFAIFSASIRSSFNLYEIARRFRLVFLRAAIPQRFPFGRYWGEYRVGTRYSAS